MTLRLQLRRATQADARFLWALRNAEHVRRSSFSTREIPLSEHEAWLRGKLTSPQCALYVAELEGQPVAQCRFELDESTRTAEVHLAVEAGQQGRGVGAEVVRQGVQQALAELSPQRIVAHVKFDNPGSRTVFARVGFKESGQVTLAGAPCLELVYQRP